MEFVPSSECQASEGSERDSAIAVIRFKILHHQVGGITIHTVVRSAVEGMVVIVRVALVVAADIDRHLAGWIPAGSSAVFLKEALVVRFAFDGWISNPIHRYQP